LKQRLDAHASIQIVTVAASGIGTRIVTRLGCIGKATLLAMRQKNASILAVWENWMSQVTLECRDLTARSGCTPQTNSEGHWRI
jgi:NADP-dependent 3-hydroxy acid dehydrogenase YdfG